jgi:hypothetical protein
MPILSVFLLGSVAHQSHRLKGLAWPPVHRNRPLAQDLPFAPPQKHPERPTESEIVRLNVVVMTYQIQTLV